MASSSASRLLLAAAAVHAEFVGKVQLDLEISDACAKGSTVTLKHPGCLARTSQPLFPAVVLQIDTTGGNATVFYGWSSDSKEAWTRATLVPIADAAAYECLEADWQKPGEAGRGYDYAPSCERTGCVTGCTISPPSGCVGGRTRLNEGETCLVRCGGAFKQEVNLTCDGTAWPDMRAVECVAEVVYCDELNGTNASNATNISGCVQRRGSTTTTTMVAQADRRFLGCSEFQNIGPGVVGMPDNLMESGTYYFEVGVEEPDEVVGFADSLWSPGKTEHQWTSTPPAGAAGFGYIGVGVRFLAKGVAEIRFAWNGLWAGSQLIEFQEPLIPIALANKRTAWRVAQDAWIFRAPSPMHMPLTQRPFPKVCYFPPEYTMMPNPPVCRDDFEQLRSAESCAVAAFHLGLVDSVAYEGHYLGWPGSCFHCHECGLSGNLYWNTAAAANTTNETIRQAPSAAAVCHRRGMADEGLDGLQNVSTSQAADPSDKLAEVVPEFRTAYGSCDGGYLHIFNLTVCETAADVLGLLYDGHATVVNLPKATAGVTAMSWPDGCFYCPLCDTAHLFFNGIPDTPVQGSDSCQGSNASLNCSGGGSSSSTPPPATTTMDPSQAEAAAGSAVLAQPICQAPPELRTTQPPAAGTTWRSVLPVTTTAAGTITDDTGTTQAISTSTQIAFTTEFQAEAGVVYLGDIQCDNPYIIERDLLWWERPDTIVTIAGAFSGCCVLSACLWFWGICHKACGCIKGMCGCCRCCQKKEEQPVFFNPTSRHTIAY